MKLPEHINELMPASIESERGLLCSFSMDPRNVGAAIAEMRIDGEHFTHPNHVAIFQALEARWRAGTPMGVRMVLKDLEGTEAGIHAPEILTHVPTSIFATEYAQTVVDKFHLRKIILKTAKVHEEAWLGGEPEPLFAELSEVSAMGVRTDLEPAFKDLLEDKLERMQKGEPDIDIIKTGIKLLDEKSPLRLGDMPLICGETKAGKSILATTIAVNVILDGNTVAIFSLEDSPQKVTDRILAGVSRVPSEHHHISKMNTGESDRLSNAVTLLSQKRLHIRSKVQDIAHICAVIRQLKAQDEKLVLAVIDYAQLVKARVSKGANREQEVGQVSRSLRLLGLELNIAILVLCQLNDDGATRESRALGMDTTAMWKIVRPAEELDEKGNDKNANKRTILIPFQRNGESKLAFPVTFFGHISRVENASHDQPDY